MLKNLYVTRRIVLHTVAVLALLAATCLAVDLEERWVYLSSNLMFDDRRHAHPVQRLPDRLCR